MTKHTFYIGHIHPHRDWMRIVVVFSILVVVIVLWSLYLFGISQTDINEDIAPKVETSTQNVSSIDKVNSFFEERAQSLASSTEEHYIQPMPL